MLSMAANIFKDGFCICYPFQGKAFTYFLKCIATPVENMVDGALPKICGCIPLFSYQLVTHTTCSDLQITLRILVATF